MTEETRSILEGDLIGSYLHPKSQTLAIASAIELHELLYPNAQFKLVLNEENKAFDKVKLDLIALRDQPYVDITNLTELICYTIPRIIILSKETKRAKTTTLDFFKSQALTLLELAYPRPGRSKEEIVTAATKHVARFSNGYWDIAATWLCAKIYFYPDFCHSFALRYNFEIPSLNLAARLNTPRRFEDLDESIIEGERNSYLPDIFWLSLVYAEAQSLEEMLGSLTLAQSTQEDFSLCHAFAKKFVSTKLKQIGMFEDGGVGLWELAFDKLNQLAAFTHCKM